MAAGMDVARVNFSHGSRSDHARAFQAVARAALEAGRAVAILADLSGPKIRLGPLADGAVTLEAGRPFVLRAATRDAGGTNDPGNRGHSDATAAWTTYPGLAADLRPGDRVLLADGAAELRVEHADEATGQVVTEVARGGTIRSRAGVNVPSERFSGAAVTDKDRRDLPAALELGADLVAQSFVRRAEDVEDLRRLLPSDRRVRVMAKIETRRAIDDFDRILGAVDAIMVARGDLGVEIPYEEVPIVQKDLVRRAVAARVPVVVATQMLESMTTAPRPTRAEASDVANAVLDGVDGILLSAETAVGAYPVEAAGAAARICVIAEALEGDRVEARPPSVGSVARTDSVPDAVAYAAVALARQDASVTAICCSTRSGRTAETLAVLRPPVPVLAFSSDAAVLRSLALRRGVVPLAIESPLDPAAPIAWMKARLLASRLVPAGSSCVFVGSTGETGSPPNVLQVERIAPPDDTKGAAMADT